MDQMRIVIWKSLFMSLLGLSHHITITHLHVTIWCDITPPREKDPAPGIWRFTIQHASQDQCYVSQLLEIDNASHRPKILMALLRARSEV